MSALTLILRSLRYHARSHLGALLGAAVGSAVLVGALVVGDSVRISLRELALARLGKIQFALASTDRFFGTRLADELHAALLSTATVAPALQLPGVAARSDGAARANGIQVLGVDDRFWQLCQGASTFHELGRARLLTSPNIPRLARTLALPGWIAPADPAVYLNQRLADQLHAKIGDTVVLRVPKPSLLPRDAPVAPQEDASTVLRLTVEGIISPTNLGDFSLQANQIPPFNAFVSLPRLQAQTELAQQANLLLVSAGTVSKSNPAASDPIAGAPPSGGSSGERSTINPAMHAPVSLSTLTAALRQRWQLADAQLELRSLPASGVLELRSGRVFLDAPVVQAALGIDPHASGILTYFVNQLRLGPRTTPYSIVTAMGAPVVPADMRDDEILINSWLAEDLPAKPGDCIELAYYVVGTLRALEERQNRFRVRAILPMQGPAADRNLMPDFPGLANVENCRDWDAGFPIQLDRIRPKDQKYWDDYRGTPKAFVTLAAGQRMWANRFGNLTAVRYPPSVGATNRIGQLLLEKLDPAELGLAFQPVRAQALAASVPAQDFGQLFLGFSFFLIVAALLLMALLFQFGIEQRATQIGTLLALGFPPRQVRRLLLAEGGGVAVLGGLLGVMGGAAYARAMVYGLATLWRDAVGTSALRFHAEPMTLGLGVAAGIVIALATLWLALRNQAARPAHELLAAGTQLESHEPARQDLPANRGLGLATLAGMSGLILMGLGALKPAAMKVSFFGAGTLCLIAGLGLAASLLSSLGCASAGTQPTLSGMGLRNTARRRKRSLATVALLASGSFLIFAIGAFRLDSSQSAEKRTSGTGGFAFLGQSALAVVQDLNSPAGRDFYGLDSAALAGVAVVPLRLHEGDDASCLNLNRAQTPRLLGVRPELLQSRGAFTFAQVAKGFSNEKPWLLLNQVMADGAVPAIADQASIVWALGKRVGDTVNYRDERGRAFKLRLVGALANSILQGSLVIAEDQFVARFSSESGYRLFLIDAPQSHAEPVAETLARALQDVGLEVTPTSRRLAALNAVQNTYLSTFQVLGGLGLLLGSLGLGVVVLRNVLERRPELALLRAVGFRRRALNWIVLSEHGALLLMGLAIGVGAAFVAVLPALLAPGAELPVFSLAATSLAVLANGAFWTWLATRFALRGELLEALRND